MGFDDGVNGLIVGRCLTSRSASGLPTYAGPLTGSLSRRGLELIRVQLGEIPRHTLLELRATSDQSSLV